MQTLPSQELKRRGLAAVESLIEAGPVEVIKRNRPACVIVSVGLYRDLTRKRLAGGRRSVSELFAQPAKGLRQRKEVEGADPFYSRVAGVVAALKKRHPGLEYAVSRLSLLECLVRPLRNDDAVARGSRHQDTGCDPGNLRPVASRPDDFHDWGCIVP